MSKRLLVFIMVLSLVLVPAGSVAAASQGTSVGITGLPQGPSGTYGSGITCTNLGSSATTLFQIVFYNSDASTVALSYDDPNPIAAGASRNYYTPSTPPGLPSPFIGSAVVSSDQQIACNVNTQVVSSGVGSSSNPARVGTSSGVDSSRTSTSLFAPQVLKGLSGWNSYIAVQNTESSAMTVNVSYIDRFGTAYPAANESISIPAQSNHIFYQGDNTNLPSNFLGGATITSSGEMAGVVNFYNTGVDATTSQFLSYTAFSSGANILYVPRFVRNFYGFQGGLTVQNIGGADTSVTVTFSFAGSSYIYTSGTIIPGATLSLYAPNITELTPVDALPVGLRTGSAIIQAATSGSIVAIVNEDNRGTCTPSVSCGTIQPNFIGMGSTYEAFADGTQTGTVFFIQVPRHVGSADYSGGFQFANTTGTATTCSIEFPSNPAANQSGVALAANGSLSYFAPNIPSLTDGFNSSVKVTCGQPIFGISNLSARNTSYLGDSYATADGLNR